MQTAKISVWTAVLININLMIGAGIYFMPPLMAQAAGNLSYIGWILVSIIFLPVVLSVANVSKLFPGEGSFYVYTQRGLGTAMGFVSGWTYCLGWVGVAALQLAALRNALVQSTGFSFFTEHALLFNLLFIGFLCLLNFFSLRIVGTLQSGVTIFKLIPLIIIILLLVPFFNASNIVPATSNWSTLQFTIPLALFGFWGFETCANISHRIRGSSSNAALAILIGFFATVLIYALVHFSLISLMGADNLARFGVPAFVNYVGLPSGLVFGVTTLINASIIAAYINAIFGSLTSSSFLLNAMAHNKLLFPATILRSLNKHGQPVATVCLQGTLIIIFSALITQQASLTAIANLGMLCAFVLTFLSLGTLQHKAGNGRGLALTSCALASCLILGLYSFKEIAHIAYLIPLIAALLGGIVLYMLRER